MKEPTALKINKRAVDVNKNVVVFEVDMMLDAETVRAAKLAGVSYVVLQTLRWWSVPYFDAFEFY